MAALDFPISPSLNQIYNANGKRWQWNGSSWNRIPDPGTQGIQGITGAGTQGTSGTAVVRAWVNFNGQGAVAIRANFNVSSITDNGTGQYTVNFSSALSDANYAMGGGSQRGSTGNAGNAAFISFNSGPTQPALAAGSARICTFTSDGSLIDFTHNTVAFFR